MSSLILASLGLSACVTPGGREASRAGSVLDATALTGAGTVERDIEAPEVFNEAETGLWDGRPSLGGVWVAHPSVRDPERVVIRNPANGSSVIGALFRRERDNPGPRFQISSEAAQALGMLAGQPAAIEVTALRLERIETAPAEAAAPAETAEPTAVAAAAAPASTEQTVAAGIASGTMSDAGTVEITSVDPEPEQPRRGLRGLFSRQRPAAPAPSEVAIAEMAIAPVAPVAEAGEAVIQTAAVAVPAAQAEAPRERRGFLGFGRRRAAEPEVAAEPAMIPMPEAVAAAPAPAPAAAPAPQAAAPRATASAGGFIQVGIFSVEENATRTRARLQQAGLTAEIRRGAHGERAFWRVVVGPLADTAARNRALTQVRGLGFADAYGVAR